MIINLVDRTLFLIGELDEVLLELGKAVRRAKTEKLAAIAVRTPGRATLLIDGEYLQALIDETDLADSRQRQEAE